MLESCFCGRTGEIEDREPVFDGEGRRALRWPDCGHLDHLIWLPEHARLRVFEAAAVSSAPSETSTAA
jgi:hypothetical protein